MKKKQNKKFTNKDLKKKSGDFYIFGRQPILEVLKKEPNNIKIIYVVGQVEGESGKKIIAEAKQNKIKLEYISPMTAFSKVGKVNDQGFIAFLHKFKYADQLDWEIQIRKKTKPEMVLLLDHLEDVGNYGAIIRTAAAADVSVIFVAGDRQAPVNGTVFKTSAGNIAKVKIIKVSNISQMIDRLKDLKFWIYAVDMSEDGKEQNLWQCKFDTNTAFILGGEGRGISAKLKEKSDFILSIPMKNEVESLNVSVSAALVMYEWKRQQK